MNHVEAVHERKTGGGLRFCPSRVMAIHVLALLTIPELMGKPTCLDMKDASRIDHSSSSLALGH